MLMARTFFPKIKNSTGTGIIAKAMKASKLVAHATPSLLYIGAAKSGKPAPARDRTSVLAARAELANMR